MRLTTRRNQVSFGDQGPASLQAHQVIWDRGDEHGTVESVAARYIEETGLYRATSHGTSLFPLASRTWELNAQYGRAATDTPGVSVAMTYRRREGTGPDGVVHGRHAPPRRSRRGPRRGDVGRAWATEARSRAASSRATSPAATASLRARWRATSSPTRPSCSCAASTEWPSPARPTARLLPRVASIDDTDESASSHSVAAGLERKGDQGASFRVQASQQKLDEVVRAFFDGDFLTDFDSVYLMTATRCVRSTPAGSTG